MSPDPGTESLTLRKEKFFSQSSTISGFMIELTLILVLKTTENLEM